MVSNAGKILLKNTIQSTEHQNKRIEENEMWKKYYQNRPEVSGQRKRKHSFDRKQDDSSDRSSDDKRYKKDKDDGKPDNYWLKKLIAAEEKLPNERWGHNGFKELYCHEFKSSESDQSESESKHKKSKKKKKKHKKHKKHKHKRK